MNDLVPSEFSLSQNYPNPFSERTTIKYCVAYKTRVVLTVLTPEGEEIAKLVDEEKKPGTYAFVFRPEVGRAPLGNGTYSFKMEAGDYSNEKRMLLSR